MAQTLQSVLRPKLAFTFIYWAFSTVVNTGQKAVKALFSI